MKFPIEHDQYLPFSFNLACQSHTYLSKAGTQLHSSTKVGLAFCPFTQKSQDKDTMDKIPRQCMAQEYLGNITQNLRAAPHLMPKYDWLAVQVHKEWADSLFWAMVVLNSFLMCLSCEKDLWPLQLVTGSVRKILGKVVCSPCLSTTCSLFAGVLSGSVLTKALNWISSSPND